MSAPSARWISELGTYPPRWLVDPRFLAGATAANLAPRALSHHAWYQTRFPEYPSRRRAFIPFVL